VLFYYFRLSETGSVKEYPATLKRLRCSVFVPCSIGAIDSTYKSRKISISSRCIFVKFSGFLGLNNCGSIAKNLGRKSRDVRGRGGKEKSLPPHFLPLGGSWGPQIFYAWGLPWRYQSSKFDVSPVKTGVRGRGNPF